MPDPLPCVPDNEAVLSFGYAVHGEDVSSLSFGYQVTPSTEEYTTLSFGYEVVVEGLTSWEPTETPVGYMTQHLGNQYPYWHAANYKNGGRTQRVLNSLAGFQLTQLLSKVRRHRANLFLGTADVSEPSRIWVAPRPIAQADQPVNVNLLLNPTLNRVYPQRLGPWGWSQAFASSTGTWELRRGAGLYGYYGVRLTAEDGQSITLTQDRDLIFRAGNSYTATVWFAGIRPERDTPITKVTGPQLQVSTQYSDGSSEISSVFLNDDTGGAWSRASVTVVPDRDTHNIQVSVVVRDYGGEKVVLDIGGLQLEAGTISSTFSEFIYSTNVLFLVSPSRSITESTDWGDVTYDRQTRIRTDDYLSYEALLEQMPDRCTLTEAVDEIGVSSDVLDAVIEPDNRQFSIGWRIVDNLIERYNADITQSEIWGYYKIADLYGDGGKELRFFRPVDLGVTSTYEALTVAGEWLYVIVKEEYLGKTHRVLKICSPYIRWDDTNHLESFADVYVDDGDGTCTSVANISGRSDQLLITIDSVEYVMDLIWDSAARTNEGIMIFRSDPGDAAVVA